MKALRQRIEILHNADITNSDGYQVKEWMVLKSIWANMIPQSNTRIEENGITKRDTRYEVEAWYNADITHDHRIRYKGDVYEIEEIINVGERNKHMLMKCVLRVN